MPLEVIVIDDGSTDGGYEWVKLRRHGALKHEQRNQPGPGGYAARNRGIELARGDWVAFLDADDEWKPDHLEKLAAALDAQMLPDEFTILFSGYESIFEGNVREIDAFSRKYIGSVKAMGFLDLIEDWIAISNSPVWTSATVCRRSALVESGMFPEGRCKRGGDKDTWLRVAHLGKVLFTGAVTANYYRDAVNMTTNKGYSNSIPCSVPTLDALAALYDPAAAKRLSHLKNLEIFNYAMVSARTEGLSPASIVDFDGSTDPWRLALLRVLATPLGKVAARAMYRTRRRLRGR
jgi:glycosyltransferase involved in cell wall biosynthesis